MLVDWWTPLSAPLMRWLSKRAASSSYRCMRFATKVLNAAKASHPSLVAPVYSLSKTANSIPAGVSALCAPVACQLRFDTMQGSLKCFLVPSTAVMAFGLRYSEWWRISLTGCGASSHCSRLCCDHTHTPCQHVGHCRGSTRRVPRLNGRQCAGYKGCLRGAWTSELCSTCAHGC